MKERSPLKAHPLFGPLTACWALTAAIAGGCRERPESATLYTSVDVPFAREVIAVFTARTGVPVELKMDTEAGKTTALVRRIRAERDRPRADVFWSSELFHTIRLADDGLLAEYRPPAEGIPERFRDPAGRWTAFGLRARVWAYHTARVRPEQAPRTWRAITDVRWKRLLGVADPQFGTTGGHFAAMYVLWGEDDYLTFLRELREVLEGRLLDGNATAARLVGRGELHACMTDTDDVYARQAAGEPVDMVYPDLGDGGTLLIPTSVGLVAGGPNPAAGRRLIDFLTSPEGERLLARSGSRNIPVRESLRRELGMELPPGSQVDYRRVAEALEPAIRLARQHLLGEAP